MASDREQDLFLLAPNARAKNVGDFAQDNPNLAVPSSAVMRLAHQIRSILQRQKNDSALIHFVRNSNKADEQALQIALVREVGSSRARNIVGLADAKWSLTPKQPSMAPYRSRAADSDRIDWSKAKVSASDAKQIEIVPLSGFEVQEANGELQLFKAGGKGLDERWLKENSRSQFKFEWSCRRMDKVGELVNPAQKGDESEGEFQTAETLQVESPSLIANKRVNNVTPHDRQTWRYGGFRFRKEGMHVLECRIMLFQNGAWVEWFEVSKQIMVKSVKWHQELALKTGARDVKSFDQHLAEAEKNAQKSHWERRLLKEGQITYGEKDENGQLKTESVWLVRGGQGPKEQFRVGRFDRAWFQVVGLKELGGGQKYQCTWHARRIGGEGTDGAEVVAQQKYDAGGTLQTRERTFEVFEFSKPGRYRVEVGVTAQVGKQTAYLTNISHIDQSKWLVYEFDVAPAGMERQNGIQSTGSQTAVTQGYAQNEAELRQKFLMGYNLVKPRGVKQVWFVVPQLSIERTPKNYWGWNYIEGGEAGKKYPALQGQSIGPWKDAGVAPMYEAPYALDGKGGQVWFPVFDQLMVPKGENTLYVMCAELNAEGKLVEMHRFMQKVVHPNRAEQLAYENKKLKETGELDSAFVKNLKTSRDKFVPGSLQPLNARYVNREQMKVVVVPLYYGKIKGSNTLAILDATPDKESMRLDRRIYDGGSGSLQAALNAYSSTFNGAHDFYPTGEMLLDLGSGNYFSFKTVGETTFTKYLSITGLTALALTIAGMVAMVIPPLAPAAPFLMAAAGALGVVSAIGDAYQQSLSVEGLTESGVAMAIISIASSMVGFGKAGFTLLKQVLKVMRGARRGSAAVRLVRQMLAEARRMGRANAELVQKLENLLTQLNKMAVVLDTLDTATSVTQLQDFYNEVQKILEDPSKASETRLWDLLGCVQRFGLNFVMSGMGVAGIKGDFKEAFAHDPAHRRPSRGSAGVKSDPNLPLRRIGTPGQVGADTSRTPSVVMMPANGDTPALVVPSRDASQINSNAARVKELHGVDYAVSKDAGTFGAYDPENHRVEISQEAAQTGRTHEHRRSRSHACGQSQ